MEHEAENGKGHFIKDMGVVICTLLTLLMEMLCILMGLMDAGSAMAQLPNGRL